MDMSDLFCDYELLPCLRCSLPKPHGGSIHLVDLKNLGGGPYPDRATAVGVLGAYAS